MTINRRSLVTPLLSSAHDETSRSQPPHRRRSRGGRRRGLASETTISVTDALIDFLYRSPEVAHFRARRVDIPGNEVFHERINPVGGP